MPPIRRRGPPNARVGQLNSTSYRRSGFGFALCSNTQSTPQSLPHLHSAAKALTVRVASNAANFRDITAAIVASTSRQPGSR